MPPTNQLENIETLNVHNAKAALLQGFDAIKAGQTVFDLGSVKLADSSAVAVLLAWQRAAKIAPTVVALRSRADAVVDAELVRLAGRLPDLDPAQRAEVQVTVRRVVDKLLHTPTVRVKELADAPEGLSYADALRELFGLDRAAPAAVTATPVQLVDPDLVDPDLVDEDLVVEDESRG